MPTAEHDAHVPPTSSTPFNQRIGPRRAASTWASATGTFVEDCEQNDSEKYCRRRLAGRSYRVLMQFGGDFVQIVANTPDGRGKIHDEYAAWFGERGGCSEPDVRLMGAGRFQ